MVGTPFPLLPMVVIAISLVTGAYSLCNLFPYVGYMVQHLGATDDKDEAGKFACVGHNRANDTTDCVVAVITSRVHFLVLTRRWHNQLRNVCIKRCIGIL